MKLLRELAKVAAKVLVENGAISAGTKIGEALGGLIGSKIYTPPKEATPEEPKP